MTLDIRIRTLAHADHRYPGTIGDWRGDVPGLVGVKVSDLGDWRYEFLVGLHEFIEATLCNARGIKDADVTAFDEAFERERSANTDWGEPGDHPSAPYCREHFFATTIERLMAAEIGVDWTEYEAAIDAAMEGK